MQVQGVRGGQTPEFCLMYWSFFDGFLAVVQSLHVRLVASPWTAAPQASLSFTVSWS